MMKKWFLALLLQTVAIAAMAADNPLSVHVLSTQDGLPAPGVIVTLERKAAEGWQQLSTAQTNEQGRVTDLYPQETPLQNGIYRVTFYTGDWFKDMASKTFFPEIPVVFEIDGSLQHYHIPLLLSPYGYSTYRGN